MERIYYEYGHFCTMPQKGKVRERLLSEKPRHVGVVEAKVL